MTTNTEKIEDIHVSEEKDGSAVVELPESMAPEQEDGDDAGSQSAKNTDAGDDDADHPDDTDAIRSARRERRRAKKVYIKKTNEEKDQRLQMLQRENQELKERMSVVERRTHGTELARMDKAIEDAELKMQYAKLKMAEATSAGDGDAMAQAQDMWYDTRRQIEAMKSVKDRAVNAPQQQGIDGENQEMRRHASSWVDNNPWYDANGDDEDSEIAKLVDQKMVKEGWNPNKSDYWSELDRRLQKRIPHRYTDDIDEKPTRRPRSVVTSSGRENINGSGAKNTFTLSPEQVRAMKDAGFWDDSEKRNKMIKRYAQEARQSQNYRS